MTSPRRPLHGDAPEVCAPGVYDPPGDSQAIKVTGAQTILFLAGQVAYDKDGGAAHPGGGTLANVVVKITTYVTDVKHRPDFRVIRDEFFGQRGPASTMIQVAALAHPDDLIEIGAVASV